MQTTTTAIAHPNESRGRWDPRPKTTKTRIYVTPANVEQEPIDWNGDEELAEATLRANNRAYIKAARELANLTLEALGLADEIGDFSWNAKAGCSCGCSPAFVAKNHRSTHSIFITERNN